MDDWQRLQALAQKGGEDVAEDPTPLPPEPTQNRRQTYQQLTWLQRNQRPLVGLLTVACVFGLYFLIVLKILAGDCKMEQKELLLIILGSLPGIIGFVLQFNFGGTMTQQPQQQQFRPSGQGGK